MTVRKRKVQRFEVPSLTRGPTLFLGLAISALVGWWFRVIFFRSLTISPTISSSSSSSSSRDPGQSVAAAAAREEDREKSVSSTSSSLSSSSSCYLPPTCTGVPGYVDPDTGFTNATGMEHANTGRCCDICAGSSVSNSAGELVPDLESPLDYNYDYDYLILDLLWNPTLCSALQTGHDFTLTHTESMRCLHSSPPRLSIHGLWPAWNITDTDTASVKADGPNNANGPPPPWRKQVCCKTGANQPPLDLERAARWDESLRNRMAHNWYDLVVRTRTRTRTSGGVGSGSGCREHDENENEQQGECGVCYAPNHEWQKHGTCVSESPEDYFRTGLDLYDTLSEPVAAIERMYGTKASVRDLQVLFPRRVNVVCDPQQQQQHDDDDDDGFVFSELQVCFGRNRGKGATTTTTMIDCPAATHESSWTTACRGTILVPE